jgi:type II secretory pathway component GspD/PulD (secretin)
MMKQTSKVLILSIVLALFAFIPFSFAEDDDFISVSPVEKQDASKTIQQGSVAPQEKSSPAPAATAAAVPAGPAQSAPAVKKEAIKPAGRNSVVNILPLDLKDRVEIRIITSSPVKPPKAALLAPPPNSRILLQLANCGVEGTTRAVDKGDVGAIRTAQHSSTAWIVIDLKKNSKWSISQDGSTITVIIPKEGSLAGQEAPPAAAVKAKEQAAATAPGSLIYRVIDVNAKNMDSKTRIIVTTDGPVKYRVKKDTSEKKISLDLIDSVSIWEKGSLKMDDGPVSAVAVTDDQRRKATNIVFTLSYNTPYTVSRDQNQIVIDVDNQQLSAKAPKKKLDLYQKISINIQSAELAGVLRLLASQTGFEFSAGPAVGTAAVVTIKEDNQTLDQVLKDILIPRNLYYEVNNDVIKVGDVAELKASKGLMKKVTRFYSPKNMSDIKQLQSMLAAALAKDQLIDVASQVDGSAGANRIMLVGTSGDVEKAMNELADIDVADASEGEGGNTIRTRAFKLENIRLNAASAEMSDSTKSTYESNQLDDIKAAITPMLTNGVGTMSINRRMSSIIVTDTESVLRKVEKLIKVMDIKLPQVSIEARLYEISVSAERDLGINWNLSGQAKEPAVSGSTILNPLDLTNGGGSLTVGALQNGLNISATLSAMESSSKATLLSAPKITVESNMPALITTSRTYYYEVQSNVINNGSVVSSSSFSSVMLPIELRVYCKVTKDGYINMMVVARVDKVEPTTRTQGPPDTTTQQASTYVNAKNDETLVMGGLIDDQVTESEQKVPLLGDLPLIGSLFKGTTKVNDKVELVIFITPSIVEDTE